MIQRLIGGAVGVLVTVAILAWNNVPATISVAAAIVGAIAAFLWPVVIGWFLVRRTKQKRQSAIEDEVAKQMAQQQQQGH